MITEILSVVLMAGGAHLLSKINGKKEDDGPSDGSSVFVSDDTGDTMDNSEESVVDNSEESTDETTVSDPRNGSLYFGDSTQEYDPFYDYAGSAFDELSLNALTYIPSTMGQALRARLIAPALLMTAEDLRAGFNRDGNEYSRSLALHEYKNGNSEISYFAAARKIKVRRVAFVLEVFNPFEEEAQLQKIVFNDIKIGNTRCMVMNNWRVVDGNDAELYYHAAKEIRVMDENDKKKLRYYPYEFIPGTGKWDSSKSSEIQKGWTQPYTKDRHYCTIPPRSSVYIKIDLPLINYDNSAIDWFGLDGFVRQDKRGKYEWANQELAKRWGVSNITYYTSVFPNAGVSGVCFMNLPAAPSLRNENLSMKISLYSDENNFIPKDDLGRRTARANYGATFDLRLLRGKRPENFTYKWEDSYMGDANLFPTENGNLRSQENEFNLETGFDLFQESHYYSDINYGGALSQTVEYENTLHEPLIEQYGLKTTKN